ncbi:hypothetical protein RUND412_010628 [Rhizina undulata]
MLEIDKKFTLPEATVSKSILELGTAARMLAGGRGVFGEGDRPDGADWADGTDGWVGNVFDAAGEVAERVVLSLEDADIYGKGKSQQLELDGDADTVIPARDAAIPAETIFYTVGSSELYTANSSPSLSYSTSLQILSSGFFADLRNRLAGKTPPDAKQDPVPGRFSDWKNPRAFLYFSLEM